MGTDNWGHTYVFERGEVYRKHLGKGVEEKIKELGQYVFMYYFRENDGWTFLNRGPERYIIIDVREGVEVNLVRYVMQKAVIDPKVRKKLEDMINKGAVRSVRFEDPE